MSASHARGPWLMPQRLRSSFSLKACEFVPVAFRASSLKWGRRDLNPILYLSELESTTFVEHLKGV